jgi:hypothetical protein
MKDFLGNELQIGDRVVLNRPGYKYLVKGVVTKLTKKQVCVEFFNLINRSMESTYSSPSQLVKFGDNIFKLKE